MRSDEDIIQVRMTLAASISLDMQRIEEDDSLVWQQASADMDLTDPDQKKQAVFRYLGLYIARELLLTGCPSTNGPGETWPIEMEIIKYGICDSEEAATGTATNPGVHQDDQK